MGKHPQLKIIAPVEAPARLCDRADDDLMLLARGGLLEAFDELVRRYQERARKVAAKHLGRPELAADVAQSTFLEVYRALPRYRPRGLFSSFLFKVLLNQCRMARRSHVFQRRTLERLSPIEGFTPGAEERILERERRYEVDRALEGLSEKLRVVLVLRFAGELPLAEIAQTLGVPLGTVKRRLFDGLARLRRELAGEGR